MDQDPYLSHMYNQIAEAKVKISHLTTEKVKNILKLLSSHKINHEQLQGYCFQGISDECNGLRPLCWKILLGYLSGCPSKWDGILETHRKNYTNFLRDHFLPQHGLAVKKMNVYQGDPLGLGVVTKKGGAKKKSGEESKTAGNSKVNGKSSKNVKKPSMDSEPIADPLSVPKTEINENNLWDDIIKDTKRTRTGMDFFQKETSFPLDKVYNIENKEAHEKESHSDVLARILFVYGRLHPGVGYVQGMNEILAPIYYCFSNDQNPAFFGHAEADSFYCFSILMGELQDDFVKSFNHSGVGIQARITNLNELLKKIDVKVWAHLESCNVNPQFYSLRWLMLLVTQEFPLIEVLRLWDTLFSHPKKLDYINYICVAMIQEVRGKLLCTDEFAVLMGVLQKDTTENVDKIISNAFKLYKEYVKPDEIIHHIIFPV